MIKMNTTTTKVRIKSPFIAGLAYILLIVFIGTLITSGLLSMSGVRESSLPYFAYPLHVFALLIGGWIAGRRAKEKGWYYGGMSGSIYAVLLLLISFLGFDKSLGLESVMILLVSFASSALGGMIGVNTRR
jgi:putative membrane protein (TIGR04086 family)